jgi:dienelactone hydrolase
MKKFIRILVVIIFINNDFLSAQEIQPLFDYWQYYSDHSNALYKHIAEIAFRQLETRRKEISQLSTKADWVSRQSEVQQRLKEIIGGFPEKTPLNPRITGTLRGNGFRVEKVIFESLPRFYVTAALFIPDDLKGKAPAVIYCSGHTFESFRSRVYQHMIINLVKKGCVVLAFDPIGQGERLQYLDEEGSKSIYSTPTHEHSYPGGQCFLTGNCLAGYMIWDGIRSVDYLLTRPEVDPERLGITGRSGGGTQSAYIAAFDPRIKIAAPECYITGFEYLFKSIGPQDAEQNFPGFLHSGLDLADLLEVRAPKPALIISTTNDFFSIQGARETYQEVKNAYEKWEKADLVAMSEDDAGHETTLKNREALYLFFKNHLGFPGEPIDREVSLFNPGDLQITATGQVIPEMDGETIFSLNKKRAIRFLDIITDRRNQKLSDQMKVREEVIRYTGYVHSEEDQTSIFSGRELADTYMLEKYLVKAAGSYFLPVVIMKPRGKKVEKNIIIFNPKGKNEEIASDSLSQWLVNKGFNVVLPDIAGFGELGPGYLKGDAYMEHTSYNQWFGGILTGKSLTGVRMEDMKRIINFLKNELDTDRENLYAIARDVVGSDLLHFTAISDEIGRIALINPLISYLDLALNDTYHPKYIQSAVPGSIQYYDLPDLASLLAPKKLLFVDVCDQDGNIIQDLSSNGYIRFIEDVYSSKDNAHDFHLNYSSDQNFEDIYGKWLE